MREFAEGFDVVQARGLKLHIQRHGERHFLCGYSPRFMFERTEAEFWGDRSLLYNPKICRNCRLAYDRANGLWLEETPQSIDDVKIILWGMLY